MGLRLSRRAQRRRAAHHRRRPRVRRHAERHGLCAERGHRLRPLGVSRRRRRARGGHRRPHRRRGRPAFCGLRRRSLGQRLRDRRGQRRAALEDEGGRLPLRPGHGLADVSRRPALRGRGVGRGNSRRGGRLRVLQIPREPGGAECGHGAAGLEDLHAARGQADHQEQDRARSCGAHPARRSGPARRSTRSARPSTSPPATTTAVRPRRQATRSWRSTWTAARSCGRAR